MYTVWSEMLLLNVDPAENVVDSYFAQPRINAYHHPLHPEKLM